MNERSDLLGRKSTVRVLWIILYCALGLSILVELFFDIEAHFGIDGTFSFSAWYGFLACVLMVVFAKLLGWFIKRNDNYYDD